VDISTLWNIIYLCPIVAPRVLNPNSARVLISP